MKIVIDIPRKTYEHIRSHGGHGIFNIQGDDNLIVTKAIFNGTVEEKPQGEWKKHYDLYVCSECGQIIGEYKKNYCATCGADMRGERR
jgi:rRNA maturation endonuclease Nob1